MDLVYKPVTRVRRFSLSLYRNSFIEKNPLNPRNTRKHNPTTRRPDIPDAPGRMDCVAFLVLLAFRRPAWLFRPRLARESWRLFRRHVLGARKDACRGHGR